MEYTVTVTSSKHPTQQLSQTIDISDCHNATGTLIQTERGRLLVHLHTLPPELAAKIQETSLDCRIDYTKKGMLWTKVTPTKGKKPMDAYIQCDTRPDCQELYTALDAANTLIDATRKALWQSEKTPVNIPDGMVKVRFSTSKLDGWIQVYRDDAGRELENPTLAGHQDGIGWMTPEAYQAACDKADAIVAERRAKEIATLEAYIAQAERQDELLSEWELRDKAREYDRAYNEGGEGFNPYRNQISRGDYDAAKAKLQHLQSE